MSGTHAVGIAIGLVLLGCGPETPPVVTAPPTPTATEAVAVEPAPTTSATAVVAAPTPPARSKVDMSAALARLPKNAAVYGMFRPVAGDTLVEWSKNPEGARREFQRLVPSGTFLELVTTLGVDPAVPVAFAVRGPDLAESQKLMEKVIGASKPNAAKSDLVDGALRSAAPNGTLIRFVLGPSTPDRDTLAELERMSEKARLRFARCPDAPQCAQFTGDKPIGVIDRGSSTIAFYKSPGLLEVDWVESENGGSEARIKLLSSGRAQTGGPAGVCTKLDSESDLSVCVDATRASEMGTALGLATTIDATRGVSPDVRGKILLEGKKESLKNLSLASPKRKLADDGTLSISVAKTGYTATGSWLLTEASMTPVQTALGRETCVGANSFATELTPLLKKAFGDPGADFKDLKQRTTDFREAGFGAGLVAFGRIWPNMLGVVEAGFSLRPLVFDRACVRAAADRLELRMAGPAIDVDRL